MKKGIKRTSSNNTKITRSSLNSSKISDSYDGDTNFDFEKITVTEITDTDDYNFDLLNISNKKKKDDGTTKVESNSKKRVKSNKGTLVKRPTFSYKRSLKNYKEKEPFTEEKKMNLIANGIIAFFLLVVMIVFYMIFGLLAAGLLFVGILIITAVHLLLSSKKMSKRKRKIIHRIFIFILALGIMGLVALIAFLIYIASSAPTFNPNNLDTQELSIVYDKDGEVIAKLGAEKREKVTYDELPQVLVDAIIATEDSRFYQHNGFDAPRFLQATFKQLLGSSNAGGASTLSMQVVKNSFTDAKLDTGVKGIIRKFTDIYLAVFKLEKNYTKEQIIEFYVNNHYLGGNIYGVEEASQAYFGKSVGDLNLSEAAIIAGMFKNPGGYSPTLHPENAKNRRTTVLYLMKRHGYITEEEEKIANSIPIEVICKDSTGKSASTGNNEYQDYIDTVVQELDKKYNVNPYKTSLLIYTNMDRSKQNGVNRVFRGESYNWVDDKIQSGVSVLESQTGKILAIGAGRNRSVGGYNFATDIKRQPGSTAKPLFDYGPGIEYNDWSTYEQFVDEPYTYSGGRSITNWDKGYMGKMTLRRALALSRNIPALKAFQKVDKSKIIEFVTSLGIKPEIENGTIHEAHSIGAFTGTNPLEMSAAYSAFSNGGYYNEPYSVSKFTYRDTGNTVEHKSKKTKAMSEATAFMISSVLQDVNLNGGGKIVNYAAKTGTTNFDDAYVASKGLPGDAIRDSWVVGFSTKTTMAMWYGYNQSTPEYCMRNLPSSIEKDKLYRTLVNEVIEKDREEFRMPDSVVKLPIVSGSDPAKVAPSGYTGNVTYEYFKKDAQPSNKDTEEERLATPENVKATFTNGTVTLSWKAVENKYSEYGTFGYNVYFGNTLLGFTESTVYTKQLANPYGTYKVVATYQSYSGANSAAGSYNLKEEVKPVSKEIKYTIKYYCDKDSIENVNKSIETTADSYILKDDDIPDSSKIPTACTKDGRTVSGNTVTNGSTITVTYKLATT